MEIIVAVLIIGFLAVATSRYIFSKQYAIQQAENLSLELITALRDARGFAMSGRQTINEGTGGEEIPEGGYGVFFDATDNHAVVFADINSSGTYDPSEDTLIYETQEHYPLLRIMVYRVNIDENSDHSAGLVSDSEVSTESYSQKNFWIIFASNTGESILGSEIEGVITDETKAFFIDIILPDTKHYHVHFHKISRFFNIETVIL